MDYKKELQNIFEGEVSTEDEVLEVNSEDTSIFHVRPACVVYPKHTEDIKALVQVASAHPEQFSLTARSAGTDMSGGPLTDSVVVSFTEHFNTIQEIKDGQVTTQPGAYYRDFEKHTLKQGLLLPSYTASKELNTVGGMVANNSAGEKSLTYGKTERWVRALKVVLSDGNEYEFRKLTRAELEAKKALDTYEGQVYRDIDWIIKERIEMLRAEKPIVSKNSAGYSIWNVWNEEDDTFDLTQLFVGSQGTLGLVTEITFELLAPKKHSRMMVMFLRKRHMADLGTMVNTVLKEGPESFESYDDKTFGIMLRIFPKLLKKLGGNPFKLLFDFLPEVKMILTGGIPKLVLMAEFVGDTEEEVIAAAKKAEEAVLASYNVSTHVTKTQKEGDKFWAIRRESFKLLRENVHGKHTAPFIDDISVCPEKLPEFLPKLYAIMDEYKLVFTIAGHIGDGNFHIIPLMDYHRPDFKHIIQELSERVYKLVGEYQGSITGEHNDGMIRTPYLDRMFSKEMLATFADIKNIFDPKNIFNPHKKVNGDMDLLLNSIKKEVKDSNDVKTPTQISVSLKWFRALLLGGLFASLSTLYLQFTDIPLLSLQAMSFTAAATASLLFASAFSYGSISYFTGWVNVRSGQQKQIGVLAFYLSVIYCVTLLMLYPETYLTGLSQNFFSADILLGGLAMIIFTAMFLVGTKPAAKILPFPTIKFIFGLGFVGYALLVMRAVFLDWDIWSAWFMQLDALPPGRLVLSVIAVVVLLLRISVPIHKRMKGEG